MRADTVFAPGARVQIRDAEWVIRRVDPTSTGGSSLLVVGISEIVRGREARFLTEIEGKGITLLDPADTELVPDPSPRFRDTRLYLESLLRQTPPTGDYLYIGHQAAMDDLPFQLDPAIQALQQPRQRILMADAVGLGKTIEVGVLLAELIRRGRGKRILAITVKSMMSQFQKELWSRFTIPLVRLDSVGIQRIRNHIPTNANPFHYYDKAIISIDTLKQDSEYRVHVENASWDIIVIDEAHNVAERGKNPSLRARLAKLLAGRSETLIMTSATPHDGQARSFASLMNMLDPTAIANPEDYGPEDIKGLFLRRFKKDIQEQVKGSFKKRQVKKYASKASPAEELAFDRVASAEFQSFDKKRRTGHYLFRTVLEKSLFSSPAACAATVRNRLKKLENVATVESSRDRETLGALLESVEAIDVTNFSKYQKLLEVIRSKDGLAWNGKDSKDRLVIFTERIETLRFLKEHLEKDLSLKDAQVSVIYGQGDSDVDIQQRVEAFGRDQEPVRLLIASDVAAEGINLHFLCHKMVHFDIPWSLMTFQQRNGRIDRYGQDREPQIAYLHTESQNEKVRGDNRILELLIEKDRQAAENIGDPSAFMGVYDETAEEVLTANAMEDGLTPEELDNAMEERVETDFLELLFGNDARPTGATARSSTRALPTLFANDLDYVKQGIEHLEPSNPLQAKIDLERRLVSLTIDEELERVFRLLPADVIPEDRVLQLTTDRAWVKDAIRRCRATERDWPDVHLLWDLHPFVEWLNFKLLVAFGRHQAPVVTLPDVLEPSEALFLVQGETPNLKGYPVVQSWFAVHVRGGRTVDTLTFDAFLTKTGFHERAHPNPGGTPNLAPYTSLLPEVVSEARRWMSERRKEHAARIEPKLAEQLDRLHALKNRQERQLEIDFPDDSTLKGIRRDKRDEKKRRIDRIFSDYLKWIEETMTVEDKPYIRIAALFKGEG